MRNIVRAALTAAALGCVHPGGDLSAEEHRAEAQRQEEKARKEEAQYDPHAATVVPSPGLSPWQEPPGPDRFRVYNPTVDHLKAAERHLENAHQHNAYADELERSEDQACAGVPKEARRACPLVTAAVETVQESRNGVRLHLKAGADGARLAASMRCHLAFSRTFAFKDRPSCPLYVRGLVIELVEGGRTIELTGATTQAAEEIRWEAHELFGS